MGAKGPKIPSSTLPTFGNLASTFGGVGSSSLGSASNFYQQLLQGGQAAKNIVAPSAMQIRQLYGGNQDSLQRFMPAGGERNLALAQNRTAEGSSIANLYANAQPAAAQGLAGLASTGGGIATQGFGALTGYQAQQNQAKAQSMGGIGSGLGSLVGGAFLAPQVTKPWWA